MVESFRGLHRVSSLLADTPGLSGLERKASGVIVTGPRIVCSSNIYTAGAWSELAAKMRLKYLALVGIVCLLFGCVPVRSMQPATVAMSDCVNQGLENRSTTYQDFLDGKPAR
jgi:hypothetical protein